MKSHSLRLAVLAITAIVSASAACAAPIEPGESKGSVVHALGKPVVTPKKLGAKDALAIPASNAKPRSLHSYGLKRSPAKPKSNTKVRTRALGDELPASVDLSEHAPAVANQGPTGSCTTFATGHGVMGWWAARTGMQGAPFAPMFLYSQIVQGACEEGTMLETSMQILQAQGIPSVNAYQPMQSKLDCATQPGAAELSDAAQHRITDWSFVDLSNPELGIKSALAAGVPVVIGMSTFSAIENANADNFLIDVPDPGEKANGAHAVAVFGYDDVGIWFMNSWGTGWGKEGWGQVSWAFVNGEQDGLPNINSATAITSVE